MADPCKQEPCKSKLNAYWQKVIEKAETYKLFRLACFTYHHAKYKVNLYTVFTLGFLLAYLLCVAQLPEVVCYGMLALFLISLFLLLIYLIRLQKGAVILKEAKKLCVEANYSILIAWSEAKEACPKECEPKLIEFSCEC